MNPLLLLLLFFSFDNYFKLIKSQNSVICLHAVQAKVVTYSLHPFNENLTQHSKYRCFSSLFVPVLSNFEIGSNFLRYTQSSYCSRSFSTFRKKKYTHHTSPLNHLSCFFYFCSGEKRYLSTRVEENLRRKCWNGGVKNRKRRNIKMMIKMIHKLENCTCGVVIYDLNSSRNRFFWVQAVMKIKKRE